MIFDSHAHYDDKQFAEDRVGLLSSMGEHNIGKIVNVGASIESSKHSMMLAEKYDFIYAAIGVHPSDISCLSTRSFAWLKKAAGHEKVVAIGEIGLDYYWDKEEEVQEQQKMWFRRQLALAREVELPVIIHSRDAAADTMEIIKEDAENRKRKSGSITDPDGRDQEPVPVPGVIHCFSYSKEQAMEYVKMGYYIGVGGVVTFKNAKKLKEVVTEVPPEKIVIETDCPYLAPEPNRGKRNSSLYLPYVIEEIARIKDISPREVEEITFSNAEKLYGISM